MQIVTSPEQALAALPDRRPLIASIGNFDGVHLGHRKLLGWTVARAAELGVPSLAVTFQPHPVEVFGKTSFKHLCGYAKKKELLAATGLDFLYVLPFTRELAALEAQAFCRKYLRPLGVTELFVGFNFRMGSDHAEAEGLAGICTEQGFQLHSAGAVLYGGAPVSSTRIRQALADGDLTLANDMLGRPHTVRGKVVHGHGRGGPLLNMPTANIDPGRQLMPCPAVYATETRFPDQPGYPDRCWPSLTSFGKNPTFGENVLSLETNLLNFCADIYGQLIEVSFLQIQRHEQKFASLEDLKRQLQIDIDQRRDFPV